MWRRMFVLVGQVLWASHTPSSCDKNALCNYCVHRRYEDCSNLKTNIYLVLTCAILKKELHVWDILGLLKNGYILAQFIILTPLFNCNFLCAQQIINFHVKNFTNGPSVHRTLSFVIYTTLLITCYYFPQQKPNAHCSTVSSQVNSKLVTMKDITVFIL